MTHVRELRPLTEWFSVQDDGQQKFSRTTFGFVTDDYCAYFGQAAVGKWDLTTETANEYLKRVPDSDLYPEAPPDITIASVPAGADVFIKTPKLNRYDELEGTGIAAKLLMHEVKSLELLKRHQHPNIIGYYGCIVRRGRIVGIVLDRYPLNLQERVTVNMDHFDTEDVAPLDKDVCVHRVESAVKHLHSLGLAHNDLSPSNIMLRRGKSTDPVIIDFGSCQPVGERLLSAGTPGWVDEIGWSTSSLQNDEVALKRIGTWLTGKVSEQSE